MYFKELVDNNFKDLKASELNGLFVGLIGNLPIESYQKRTGNKKFGFGKYDETDDSSQLIFYKGLSRLLNRAQITDSFKRWLRTAYVQTYRQGFRSAFDGTNPLGLNLVQSAEIDFPIIGGIFNAERSINLEKIAYRQFMGQFLTFEQFSYQRSLIKYAVEASEDIETISTSPKYLNPLQKRRAIWKAEFKARNNNDIESPIFFTN